MSVSSVFSSLVIILVLAFSPMAKAQVSGCTDPQALNFNPEAVVNDGSCYYPKEAIKPLRLVRSLPNKVRESSGLICWNGYVWTHNDSGGKPELYKLDILKGKVHEIITIVNAKNVDWEDITQDDDYIYIGDMGNNLGIRTDLLVYKVSKTDILTTESGRVTAESIHFSYGDQTEFVRANLNNNYDCEAMLSFGDSLYLFSKNWVDKQLRMYALPKEPGEYVIYPISEYNVDGLVTGADVSPSGREAILVGYKDYNPFIVLLFDFKGSDFFGGNKRRIDFAEMFGTQTEGVAYLRDFEAIVSSEKTIVSNAGFFKIFTRNWTGPALETQE